MKRGMIWIILFFVMPLLGMVLGTGCAGSKQKAGDEHFGQEDAYLKKAPYTEKRTETDTEKIILVDERGESEVVSTPLGLAKKRIEKGEEGEESSPLDRKSSVIPSSGAALPDKQAKAKAEPGRLISVRNKPKASQQDAGQIVLNFEDADLYEVIKTIADLLKINYIVDPGVRGKVTIHTARRLSRKDLFPVFLQILEVNGLTAVKEGSLYRIVHTKDTPRMPIDSRLSLDQKDIPLTEKTIIQIIPLKFISTEEMTKLVKPFISAGGIIVPDPVSNTLIVVDKGINILKVLRLVQTFDINMLEKVHYRFYPIKYLDAEDVTKTLSDFTSSYGKVANVMVKFIAIDRLNTLFVVSTNPLVFEKIEDILSQIDVIDEEVAPKIYIYFVKNGEAKDLASLLDKVFKKKTSAKDKTKDDKSKAGSAIPGNPFSEARIKEKKEEKAAAEAKAKEPPKEASAVTRGEADGSGTLMGEVHITPDEIRNALIIEAIPSDHRIIEEILRRIDVLPRQVLIEATIAEIKVDNSTALGMNWALGKGAAEAGTGSFAAAMNKVIGSGTEAALSGFTYSVGVTDKWFAALNALANEGKVKVLSSPHVLASDNKEAKIDVSREVPVATGKTTVASGATVSETSIEYRDTGVILYVTPHINDRGLVTMDISEEVSELEKEVEVAGQKYPSFFKRTVHTTLTVKHGQTIVIGGLIRDKEEEDITGVPCLIKIPLVRYMFGQWSKSVEKIELIVLITPRVVANLDDVDTVTQEFKQKVRNVMNRFYPQ